MTAHCHIPNREALGSADNLEAFTPDRMSSTGFRRLLTAEDIQAVREGVALDRLARAIGEAVRAKDPSIRIDGPWLRYPEGNAVHGREDLDLREFAERLVTACMYCV